MTYTDFSKFVDPLTVRDVAVRLTAPFARHGYWNMTQAVALFEFVRQMPYVARPLGMPEYEQTIAETLQRGAGHCSARALLFASLCRSVGITSRLAAVHGREGHHLLTEIFLGTYPLEGLYADLVHTGCPPTITEKYRAASLCRELDALGNAWLIADATMSRFAGDIDPLIDSGFATRYPPSWVWTNPPAYFSDGSTPSPQFEESPPTTLAMVFVLPGLQVVFPGGVDSEVRAPVRTIEMGHP
ncbi:MAG TPA: transglutaminase-like domain-containing protein [Thermoanaerobaculia bacterium]|nr:transglutaminase-like domain-containing protein [Thermoanaerobaculia bacterium]